MNLLIYCTDTFEIFKCTIEAHKKKLFYSNGVRHNVTVGVVFDLWENRGEVC
jgi:hypothetical protein